MALVRFIVPRAKLGRGIATIALVVATCSAAGPSMAAAILAVASWHWLFTFNVPFGMLAVVAGGAVTAGYADVGAPVRLCQRGAERGDVRIAADWAGRDRPWPEPGCGCGWS